MRSESIFEAALHFGGEQKILSCTPKILSFMRIPFLRTIISTVCLSAVALHAGAQQKWTRYRAPEFAERPGWSLGLNFGMSDLWGDVGTKSPLDHYTNDKYWTKPHFMGGIFARYAMHPAYVLRLGLNYGSVYANDNFNYTKAKSASSTEDDAYQRYYRNLDVKSNIWEGNVMLELNIRRMGDLERAGAKKRMQPYLLVGVGGMHFRPKGTYTARGTDGRMNGQSREVDLYDLNLEGNGITITDSAAASLNFKRPAAYSLWNLVIPLGFGLRWDLADQLSLGIEYMYRYTFTDYLDNVSGYYVDPGVFEIEHAQDPQRQQMAKDMYDKSWQIDPNAKHGSNELRGNSGVPDGYSTIAISFYYRLKTKKVPWWYQP
jgi:opacity protein-like surface antigen